MQISCEFHYDAAHQLPNVPSGHKCGRLHGHTYQLTVVVEGDPLPDTGWIADFADVKDAVAPIIDILDHHYLNNISGLENPTAEVQLLWLWSLIDFPGLVELRLREGVSNTAVYRGEQ
jgi:6-pyruvoyltetrahydropterin/6-carboxytetrahydropterin synthase